MDASNPSRSEWLTELEQNRSFIVLRESIHSLQSEFRFALPYHGWVHTKYVANHASRFAKNQGADLVVVGTAGLVHDLNYLVGPGTSPSDGVAITRKMMRDAGYRETQIDDVLSIVQESHTGTRGAALRVEAACLSDADSLFKVLPITPILLARSYMDENEVSLAQLASKIVREQEPLLSAGVFFYLDDVKLRYGAWARETISMWKRVLESLEDDDVRALSEEVAANHVPVQRAHRRDVLE